jgi:hypothetical protein
MRVAQIVDDIDYVNNNCWQHQIVEALQENCQLDLFALGRHHFDTSSYDVILSTLKLRTIASNLIAVKQLIGDRQILIYDQDPWEGFIDSASYKGSYQTIASKLNVVSFLNTSQYWVDIVKASGLPSELIRMWMLPRYCDVGTQWSQRSIKVGFKGSLHPYRKRQFSKLKDLGIDVTVLAPGNYDSWLRDLSEMQFFVHFENDEPWSINGVEITKNCCWAKEIEIAARGCFTIRQREPEAAAYFIDQIPSVLLYDSLSEVPSIIDVATRDSLSDRKSIQGVDFVRSRQAWSDLLTILAKHSC